MSWEYWTPEPKAKADIIIPPAALEAGRVAGRLAVRELEQDVRIGGLTDDEWDEVVSAAFLAIVEAWPGMDSIMLPRMVRPGHFVPQNYIRLPLPQQENSDDR